MMAVNLEEYREWLRENGNLEEAKAPEVIERIVKRHLSKVNWQSWDGKTRSAMIGIEFKEWDFSKVVEQAVYRRRLFDYMYIATRPVALTLSWEPYDFTLLIKYGIGWVLWSGELVYLLLPAKKKGWERAEEMAKETEDLMSRPLKEPKRIMDYVR